jgi:hemerythrin superfamily protein
MARGQAEDVDVRPKRDALSLLHQDHERAQSLYEGFQTAGGDDRFFLASRILRTLEQHARIEAQIFYPVVQARATTREGEQGDLLVRTALEEHDVLHGQMAKVKDMLMREEGFELQFDNLMGQVQQHVAREEEELFPLARNLFTEDELMLMADDIRRLKLEVDSTLAA